MRVKNCIIACGIAFGLFLGCRTGTPPPPVTGIQPDSEMREMGRLAFLAYVGDALKGSDSEVEGKLAGCMVTALEQNAKDWELAWGPAVYHFASPDLDDNMMYVARSIKKPGPPTLAVVVRGTNPKAVLDWLVEDFDVVDQVSWPGSPSGGKISKGTSEGLEILEGMTAVVNKSTLSERLTLKKFLHGEVHSQGLQILYVTGHSLGGALSPALALWLKENQNEWDPAGKVQIRVYPLAGPTAGNAAFAAYYDQQLGSSTRRMWNPFDLVPLAWNHESMGKMEDLYEPLTRANPVERGLIDGLRSIAKDGNYTQINESAESLSGFVPVHNLKPRPSCASEKMDWLGEVGWQHHWGYQCALGILINPSVEGCPSKTSNPCPEICQPN